MAAKPIAKAIKNLAEEFGILTEKQAEKIGRAREEMPAFNRAAPYMLPDELAKAAHGDNAVKMAAILDSIASASELASAAKGGQAARGFYRKSSQAIIDVFGEDAPRFAGLLASMSPQADVRTNLKHALRTWDNWIKAGRPTDERSISAIVNASVDKAAGSKADALEAWRQNTVRTLSAEDPQSFKLSGPKVSSFMANLRDDVWQVTNDTWQGKILGVEGKNPFSGSGQVPGVEALGEPGVLQEGAGKSPRYIAASARTRQAAEKAEMLPQEAQETSWTFGRTLSTLAENSKKLFGAPLSEREILEKRLLTPESMQGGDFGSLLSTPEFGGLLSGEARERAAAFRPPELIYPQAALTTGDEENLMRTAKRLERARLGAGAKSAVAGGAVGLGALAAPEDEAEAAAVRRIPPALENIMIPKRREAAARLANGASPREVFRDTGFFPQVTPGHITSWKDQLSELKGKGFQGSWLADQIEDRLRWQLNDWEGARSYPERLTHPQYQPFDFEKYYQNALNNPGSMQGEIPLGEYMQRPELFDLYHELPNMRATGTGALNPLGIGGLSLVSPSRPPHDWILGFMDPTKPNTQNVPEMGAFGRLTPRQQLPTVETHELQHVIDMLDIMDRYPHYSPEARRQIYKSLFRDPEYAYRPGEIAAREQQARQMGLVQADIPPSEAYERFMKLGRESPGASTGAPQQYPDKPFRFVDRKKKAAAAAGGALTPMADLFAATGEQGALAQAPPEDVGGAFRGALESLTPNIDDIVTGALSMGGGMLEDTSEMLNDFLEFASRRRFGPDMGVAPPWGEAALYTPQPGMKPYALEEEPLPGSSAQIQRSLGGDPYSGSSLIGGVITPVPMGKAKKASKIIRVRK